MKLLVKRETVLAYLEIANKILQGLAIIIAALWAVTRLDFEENHRQAKLPAQLDIQTTLDPIGEKDGIVAVRARIAAKNISQTHVEVVGSWFNILAHKLTDNFDSPSEAEERRALWNQSGTLLEFPRMYAKTGTTVVNRGRILPTTWHFEPGEESNTEIVTFIPSTYQLAELRANFILAKERAGLQTSWNFENDGRINFEHRFDPWTGKTATPPKISYTYGIAFAPLWARGQVDKSSQGKD